MSIRRRGGGRRGGARQGTPRQPARRPPAAAAHAAAAPRACTRPAAHTARPGHTPQTSRPHDPISTSSTWLSAVAVLVVEVDANAYTPGRALPGTCAPGHPDAAHGDAREAHHA